MRAKEIKKLIDLVETSNISELEVSRWGRKVRIRKNLSSAGTIPESGDRITVVKSSTQEITPQAPGVTAPAGSSGVPVEREGIIEIRSPMVGTFYRAPAPDASPFVEVNQVVPRGKVLCIIEAMKLMNEIEAEIAGRIVEIHVKNTQPVEYNQLLFTIEKSE
ncbi:acetyl-CoA carboxylase biotin carboxyl carrier protein [candidate division KSB1 bacterium]|nr:acetyl-CoA carboxylase biotin carboxyl carrier protein [candidate division KSB1 bacterium]